MESQEHFDALVIPHICNILIYTPIPFVQIQPSVYRTVCAHSQEQIKTIPSVFQLWFGEEKNSETSKQPFGLISLYIKVRFVNIIKENNRVKIILSSMGYQINYDSTGK